MVRKPPYSFKRLVNVYKVRLNVYKIKRQAHPYPAQRVSVEELRCYGAWIVHSHQSTKLSLGILIDGDVFRLERNSLHLECLQDALLLLFHLHNHTGPRAAML